jgi:hypothetical protein
MKAGAAAAMALTVVALGVGRGAAADQPPPPGDAGAAGAIQPGQWEISARMESIEMPRATAEVQDRCARKSAGPIPA